jgi:hypothetical protein
LRLAASKLFKFVKTIGHVRCSCWGDFFHEITGRRRRMWPKLFERSLAWNAMLIAGVSWILILPDFNAEES